LRPSTSGRDVRAAYSALSYRNRVVINRQRTRDDNQVACATTTTTHTATTSACPNQHHFNRSNRN
jgi:hypothetical protein